MFFIVLNEGIRLAKQATIKLIINTIQTTPHPFSITFRSSIGSFWVKVISGHFENANVILSHSII